MQLNDILFLSKLYQEKEHHKIELPDVIEIVNQNMALLKLPKRGTEMGEVIFFTAHAGLLTGEIVVSTLRHLEG